MIISTHSIDVLYVLTQIQPKNARILILTKDQEDIVKYKSMGIEELEDCIGSGIDVRKIIEGFKL